MKSLITQNYTGEGEMISYYSISKPKVKAPFIPILKKYNEFKTFIDGAEHITEIDLKVYLDNAFRGCNDREGVYKEIDNKFFKVETRLKKFHTHLNLNYYPTLNIKPSELEYMTIEQVASKYNVTDRTVYNWIEAGLEYSELSKRMRVISIIKLNEFFSGKSNLL